MGKLIISTMAGAGKSTLTKSRTDLNITDSDSAGWSFVMKDNQYLDVNGNPTQVASERVTNPNFVKEYMAEIDKRLAENDVVFVSAHKTVRDALNDSGKDWIYVAYKADIKDEVVERIRNRDSEQPNEIIANITEKFWDDWMDDAKDYPAPKKYFLGSGEYLSDLNLLENIE